MKRINKTAARKLFNQGKEITLLPCKANAGNFWWRGGYKINNESNEDFDKIVNKFEYYSCNSETGYYSSYYINE